MAQMESESLADKCRGVLKELYVCETADFDTASEVLARLRVLTREKTLPFDVIDKKCIGTLVDYAAKGQTEAQKCLSNLILNYGHLRNGLVEPYVTCVEERLKDIGYERSDVEQPKRALFCEILYYDLRIVFLLSALCPASRSGIRDRLLHPLVRITSYEACRFSDENHLLVIESLKTLFNLTMDKCLDASAASELIQKLFSLVGTERDVTASQPATDHDLEHTDRLLVNLIHLLTNIPEEVYLKLSNEDVDKVLEHLDDQLKSYSKSSFRDTVLPVLNTCANICRYKEDVRQRWFDVIIGSTTDFEKRPEEYDTLRGRLVKLMTSVDVHIKEIAAEFLHALCGGDTEKFITYTGFGNSVAFLATKGLLTRAAGKSSAHSYYTDQEEPKSSADQGYQVLRSRINPITGKVEQPKKDPMEGMSEEEKEWHAHELASAISKLSNLGIIKPMRVGDDNQITELELPERDAPAE